MTDLRAMADRLTADYAALARVASDLHLFHRALPLVQDAMTHIEQAASDLRVAATEEEDATVARHPRTGRAREN